MSLNTIEKGIYRHYKGNYYQVTEIAKHADTEVVYVVYRLLYGNFSYWVRELSDFTQPVIIDNKEIRRFTLTDLPIGDFL